jgi:hypothetical protein
MISRQKVLTWLLVLGIFAMPMLPLASAGTYIGAPTFSGSIIVDNGQALGFEGIITWGAAWQPITNGSQVFSNEVNFVFYDLTQNTLVLKITTTELGTTFNTTTTVYPNSPDEIQIALISNTNWNTVQMNVAGVTQYFSVATPISLLPPSIFNVGGLDLLVLVVISEAIVAFGGAVAAANAIMRRALWAPRFSLLIWGHVVLVGVAGAVLIDYQFVDSTFAGWSPLVYVFVVTPMFLAFLLSYFNRAPSAALIRANAPLAGKLTYSFYPLLTAKDARGREVLIDPSWRGFWARIFGHHVVLVPAEAQVSQPEPFVAAVINRRIISKREFLKRVARPSERKATPLDDFDVIPSSVDGRPLRGRSWLPVKLFWTPAGRPVNVEWPRLTIHKSVVVPARYNSNGTMMKPEQTKNRLTWPHYLEGSSDIVLAPIHYRSAQSVTAGWRTAEDLAEVLSDTALDLEATKSSFETEVARKVRERLVARESLMGRTSNDMDEIEAAQEAVRMSKDNVAPLDSLLGRGPVSSPLDTSPTSKKGKK